MAYYRLFVLESMVPDAPAVVEVWGHEEPHLWEGWLMAQRLHIKRVPELTWFKGHWREVG